MKQIAITTFLFLFAHILISQHPPGVHKNLDKAAERPGDPFADLPATGKQHASLGGRNLNHTQLDSAKYWAWDETLAVWFFDAITKYSYSPNTEIVLSLDEALENQYLETLQYDDNGKLLEYIFQFWTGSSWANSSRYTYVYDDNDQLIEFTYQSASGGNFENNLRFVYTYDGNGDLVEQLGQNWVAIAWANDFRRTYTYNGNHQQVLVLQEDWQNGWFNQFRYTYTYGNSDELLTYQFDEWVGDWQIDQQTNYTYDDQLRLVEEEIDIYDGGLWLGQTKIIYTYDDHGNVISETSQNTDSGQLQNTTRQLYEYDDENNQISNLFQYWITDWVNYDSAHYYWNPVTSISNTSGQKDHVVVFPNPAAHELNFKLEAGDELVSYEIQSLDGKLMQRARAISNQSIDIAGLPGGMYVLRLHDSQQVITQQRFIKM